MKPTDYLLPDNWRNYIEGNAKYLNWKNRLIEVPAFTLEQVLLRAYQCRDCLKAGKCLVCSCGAPNLFFAPSKVDSKKRWLPWHDNAADWILEKEKSNDWKELEEVMKNNNVSLDDNNIFSFIESVPWSETANPAPTVTREPKQKQIYINGVKQNTKRA